MTHLVLVGLMGAGKTSVGEAVARRLGRRVVDTDALVERRSGETVAELFARGEATFRAAERAAVADAATTAEPLVISCGGGAVLDPDNRDVLRAHGRVIWLRARPETLSERVGGGDGRPLLADGVLETLTRLAAERAPAYEAAAHAAVDTDGLSLEDVVDRVLGAFAAEAA